MYIGVCIAYVRAIGVFHVNSLLTGLNKEQQQRPAVQHTEGPLLILMVLDLVKQRS